MENSHPGLSGSGQGGSGQDGSSLEHIFEPFYRAVTGQAKTKGAGLGLALVKKITTCHGGEVAAQNSDIGLLFTVLLPGASRPLPSKTGKTDKTSRANKYDK